MTYNPKIKNISKDEIQVTAKVSATNVALGQPDPSPGDQTYLDGLFPFTHDDNVGTAIDKINEVLGKLAPPSAPTLDSLNSSNSGQSQFLADYDSYEAGDNDTVIELKRVDDDRILSSVLMDKGAFDIISDGNVGGSKYRRLGVFSAHTTLTFFLNGTVEEDLRGDHTNYRQYAYDTTQTADPDQNYTNNPEIKVFVNGSEYTGTGLTITPDDSPNQTARFPSGEEFDGFRHSVTQFTLSDINLWKRGHNYIQVKYVVGNTTIDTSYADWFYAPDEAAGGPALASSPGTYDGVSVSQYQVPDVTEPASESDFKFISGIKYIKTPTSVTVKPTAESKITNYGIECYPKNYGISIIGAAPITNKSAGTLGLGEGDVNLLDNTIDISSIYTNLSTNKRLLSDVLHLKVNADNGLGKSKTFEYKTTQKYLYDSFNTLNGTADHSTTTSPVTLVADTFEHENFRTADSSYVPSSTTQPTKRSENAQLTDGEALVYNGRLMHPKAMPAIDSSVFPTQDNNVDFSNHSSVAYYYRWFRKSGSGCNNLTLEFATDGGVQFGTFDEQNTKWTVAVQTKTGTWLDVNKSSDVLGGAGSGTFLSTSGNTAYIAWTVNGHGGAGAPLIDQYFLLRISIPPDSSGYIETITIKDVG